MGYAYEWLTEKEKNYIETFRIKYTVNKIRIVLGVGKKRRHFVYTKDVEGFTSVVDILNRTYNAWTNKYFVDVACEDLNLLMANQKPKLRSLEVVPDDQTDYDQKAMDPIINKIFENLSQSVASRPSPLQITDFYVSPTKVSEAMPVICHLDQSELRTVWFCFEKRNEPGKIDDTMIAWNGDSGWKALWFSLDTFTREDLEGLSKIVSSQRFDEIDVLFNSRDEENIGAFFDATLFKVEFDGNSVSIKPSIERRYPILDENKTSQLELIKSSLPENVALEVLGNSVIMEIILGELIIFQIQRLRKVCRGVRDCIDDVKPEPHINAYTMEFDEFRIIVKIESKNISKHIIYMGDKEAQSDYYKDRSHQKAWLDEDEKRALEDFSFNSTDEEKWLYACEKFASNDVHINLLHQKTCLEDLRITAATNIRKLLKERKTALKVENLTIDAKTHEDVMRILPYIDKDSLKKITIIRRNGLYRNELITDVVEIARTEQWKRASQLSIEKSPVITPIREMNITHFSTVDIRMQTLSTDDILYLKTELLKSSTLKKFNIKFKTSAIDGTLQNLIGEPYRAIPDVKKIWYFRMPYTNYYLHIVLDTQDLLDEKGNPKPKTIVFSRVPKEYTPFF